jgi:hypothetical protein
MRATCRANLIPLDVITPIISGEAYQILIMQSSPARCKYCLQWSVPKHSQSMRAVCKVRGLTLLLRVGTLWRCGDGLFFEIYHLASDALLTTLHPLLENGVTVVLKEPFLSCWSKLTGASALRDWKVAMDALNKIGGTPSEHPPYSPDLAPCDFWAFPTTKREVPSQNRLFHYPPESWGKRSAARFREVDERCTKSIAC